MFFEGYWDEFVVLAIVHILALMSPGPDFAVVVKNAVSTGRRAGVATAIGIGVGASVHISYCLLGIGVVLRQSDLVFGIIQLLGASYLFYLGVKGLRAKPRQVQSRRDPTQADLTFLQGFWQGILTNLLNPKCTLFMLSIFTVLIDPETPILVQLGYAFFMITTTWIWFSLLAVALSGKRIRTKLVAVQHWVERAIGLVLCGLALLVVLGR